MKLISTTSQEWQRLCARQTVRKRRIEERVRAIVDDVCQAGDEALLRYTRRFDHVRLKPRQLPPEVYDYLSPRKRISYFSDTPKPASSKA